MNVHILDLADVYNRKNMLRIHRRSLRDATDPFYLPEARFVELFKFSKDAALELLNELSPFMKSGVRKTYIPKSVRMLVSLHFYTTGSYLRDISEGFVCAVSRTMMYAIIKEVSNIISDKLMSKYVKYPTTDEEKNKIKLRFYTCTGFPGVVGAIDSTHVTINNPPMGVEQCYRNRKGYFSKNVQLICDYDLNIQSCYARYSGSTLDAFIWENSIVNDYLENQYTEFNDKSWLIGDSEFPLQPWLMTPFLNPANANEEKFNYHHIKARNCVERLNGVIKKVFACLSDDQGLSVGPADSGTIINACITLHNIRLKRNLPLPEINEDPSWMENDHQEDLPADAFLNQGREVRDSIVRSFFSDN